MPIQFPCESCGKFIEVDDELAGELTACPYCQGTMTAPARADQASPPAPSPTAAPEAGPVEPSEPVTVQVFDSAPASGQAPHYVPDYVTPGGLVPNRLGNWGLTLAVVSWCVVVLMTGYVFVQAVDQPPLQGNTNPTPEDMQEAMGNVLEDPSKSYVINIAGGVTILCAVAGCGLSIWGLRRRGVRKGTAIAGLVMGGTLLTCQCVSVLGAFWGSGG